MRDSHSPSALIVGAPELVIAALTRPASGHERQHTLHRVDGVPEIWEHRTHVSRESKSSAEVRVIRVPAIGQGQYPGVLED
jgi:hypothetical protein